MTIKEAFEKLTSVCAAGMKNPFFVMRKLHDAFADIADKIEGGGGGSTVEVTQVVSTGTKIATITVNDTPTDLYAPNTEVVQTLTEGTKIGSVAGTDLFAPAGGGGGGDFFVFTTTESKVGSFLGVDAYAIGYDLGSDVSVANNAWETLNITTAAVKFLQVFGVSSQGNFTPLQAYKDGQKISIKACSQRTESVRYLGVIYTKS